MPIQKFELVLKWTKMLTPSIMHLAFERADKLSLDFVPGQFISFIFPADDGKVKRRSYSVATIPGQSDEIEVSISYIKGGIASEILFNLKPGDRLAAMGPAGRLIMQDDDVERYFLVGTGTGIAPYRAMLPALAKRLQRAPNFHIVILQGVQYRHDLLYGNDFIEFAKQHERVQYRACFSQDDLLDPQQHEVKGYVQKQFAKFNLQPGKDAIYLCGNPNMIDAAFADLTELGFDSKNVRREKYISSN